MENKAEPTGQSQILTLRMGGVTVEHSIARQINTLLLQDPVHLPPVTPKYISWERWGRGD